MSQMADIQSTFSRMLNKYPRRHELHIIVEVMYELITDLSWDEDMIIDFFESAKSNKEPAGYGGTNDLDKILQKYIDKEQSYKNQGVALRKDLPVRKETKLENKNMDDTKLRGFIRKKVLEFLTEKKILAEAEKEGKSKPTSGMTKTKSTKTHTDSNKTTGPKAGKVTTEGPGKSTVANSEPTAVDNEVKVMKKTDDEPIEKGKDGKQSPGGYKTECLGVTLDVKGISHADINHLYLIGQVRKSLEGRGTYVKKVTIEMGEPEKLEESKEVVELRTKIRGLIKEELKKKDKLIIEGINDTKSFLEELDDSEKTMLLSVLHKFESEGGPVGKDIDDLQYYTMYSIDLSLKKASKQVRHLTNKGRQWFTSLIEKYVNFTGADKKFPSVEHTWSR